MKIIGIAGLTLMIVAVAAPALAYIGPGAGVTVIGAVLGIVATVAVVIFSLVWYPVRRLRAKRKKRDRGGRGRRRGGRQGSTARSRSLMTNFHGEESDGIASA